MRKRVFIRSIFFRYVFVFVLIILISFSLLTVIISTMVRNHFTDMKENEIERLAESAKNLLEIDYGEYHSLTFKDFIGQKSDEVQSNISAISSSKDLFILVTDLDGCVLAFDKNVASVKSCVITSDINDAVIEQGKYNTVSTMGVFNEKHYVDGVCVKNSEQDTIAVLYACSPMSTVNKPMSSTVKMLVTVCMWVMFATIVASYLISEKIIRPVKNVSKAAKAFASGDFTVRVPIRGNDEMTELAAAFNNMAANLDANEKMRNTFIANVSHDLRSPMTTIAGFIDGILDGAIPPEKHEYYLNIIAAEVRRLSRLVATLLDISRIEAGERKFTMSTFDICEMARQILISLEKRIDEKRLEVRFECDEDRTYVCADMDAIYQVFYNLCDNAVKFSKEEGLLEIKVGQKEKSAVISVYNEGKGIVEEDLPYVFDRFYKGDKSRGLDKSGVGLGLYICKTIIDSHKQKITVESKSGENCKFTFTLKRGYPKFKNLSE